MAREPDELVEMRRTLGAQLAVFRQAAELSQAQLARVALVDRTTVAHIEKGRTRSDERFWTIVDAKCQAGGALMAGFRAWEAAKQQHDVRLREAQLAAARASAQELRATISHHLSREAVHCAAPDGKQNAPRKPTAAGPEFPVGWAGPLACPSLIGSLTGDVPGMAPDEVIGQLARLLCRWVGAMNRRELLQLLSWAAGTTAVPTVVAGLNTDEQERLVRAIVSPKRVDEQVIDHIETMLRYCKRQEDALGARAVLPTALGQRNLVHDLLRECPARLRPRLLAVYSDMSTSIGFYFFDLNDCDSASGYWNQARTAAQDAENVELSIYALCEMSHAAYWQGNAQAAIDTAAAARNLLGKTDDPLMQVCVADKAAQGYALDGQQEACMAECEKAQEGLESATHTPTGSPAYWYHEGQLASERSGCLLQLGKPQDAATSANNGLALFDDSFVNSRAFCTLRLGNAHLQSDEIDEAARVIGDAAGLATQTRSARLAKELRATRARMEPWQNTLAVKALDDQLATYGLATSSAT